MLEHSRWGLSLGALVLVTRPAYAGCPNTCEITVGAIIVDPPLACVNIAASPDTCDCGVFASLTNDCTTAVSAVDFQFNSCGPPGASVSQLTQPCAVVDPNMVADSNLRTSGTGSKQWVLKLQNEGTNYVATLNATVSSSGSSGCAFSIVTPATGSSSILVSVLGLGLGISRRRRGRKHSL